MKVGRNNPCPCGSGKKHKRCCATATPGSSTQRSPRRPMNRARQVDPETAFDRYVTRIDGQLREEEVPIPDRPAAAVAEAARVTASPLRSSDVPDRDPTPGVYHGDDLVIRIRRWYERRYKGALGPATRIESEAEFLQHMEEIDEKLRAQGTPIPGRPLVAIGEFAARVSEELRGFPLERDPVPGRYTGDDLVIHIARWYQDHYGDKLNIRNKTGEVVILLRGDPWIMELPLIYGGGRGPRFVCEYGRPTTLPNTPQVYRRGDPPPAPADYNVLDAIVGLPDGLAESLTEAEREGILQVFLWGREAYEMLWRPRRTGLVGLAQADLRTAVTALSGHDWHPGPSKWASLQASEKLLKAFIEDRGGTYKFSHDLSALEAQAVGLGLPTLDSGWIQAVQCPAGVRYGQPAVSLAEAVDAHHGSLRVVTHVVPHLSPPPTTSGM